MMAMSMTACGGSGNASTSESAAKDAQGAEGADGEVFKIGGIGPITGAAGAYGEAVKNGTELAINEINEAGGINGYQVAFNFQDDENDPEKAINAYNTLKDWNMQMLLGTVTSKPCIAVVAETAADNLFQLTPSGSAVESISGDNAFRVCYSIRIRDVHPLSTSASTNWQPRSLSSTTAPASTLMVSASPS